MNLVDKLKATLTELDQAKVKGLEAQHLADMAKIRKERKKIQDTLNKWQTNIVTDIESGKIPYIKISDYNLKSWIHAAIKGNAKHQELWQEFVSFWDNEQLTVSTTHQHDGVGIKDWIELTVKPYGSGFRHRGIKS